MADLKMEREFAVTPETLFAWISDGEKLLQWWGPEEMYIPEHNLDFTRSGPWYSVMLSEEGQKFKVSGHVTHIDPPKSVGFTWGWHDEDDQRGAESHVTLTVETCPKGARLVIDHRDLGDDEISASHERGWASTLRKLEALLQ